MAIKFVNGEAITMTAAEEAALKADQDAIKVELEEAAVVAAKRVNDTASAKTKLKELGLTDDELAAILRI